MTCRKRLYIFVIVKQKHLTFTDCCRRNTRTWFLIRQVLLFDNNKDIQSFATSHYAKCDVKLTYKLNLHIKQTKIKARKPKTAKYVTLSF